MNDTTWAHRATHPLVTRLVGTPIRPNHLTALRLATGLGSAWLFATGSPAWAGFWFVVSALLDRADGELARMGNHRSRFGHYFDLWSDIVTNVMVFVAIGIGLQSGPLGEAALWLGLIAGAAIAMIFAVVLRIEQLEPPSPGRRTPIDPDDALFIIGPVAWLGWLTELLVAAAIGAPAFLIWAIWRLFRLQRRDRHSEVKSDP